ncbi:hypothetical protein WMZ97_17215 [Lentibacillus sp. N15]|uniref:hypothetical protein n=1 Tax=Lentibacillus songyuanensis TaxID=3136161 RepID=UPI0031BB2C99
MNTYKDNFNDETVEKAKEKVESYIRNNYQNVETVEFDDGDFSSPMGGLLTVNGKAGFSIDMDEETFCVGSIGESEGFPKVKEECKKSM